MKILSIIIAAAITTVIAAALSLFLLNCTERKEVGERKFNGILYGIDVEPFGYSNDSLQLFYLTTGEEKQDTSWMACTDFDKRENCCESRSMKKAIELTFIHSEKTTSNE
jgi:hypothetical protein